MADDKHVKQAVLDELQWEPSVNGAHIGVTALGGSVKLTGNVDSWYERDEAGSAAWAAPGTTSVQNNISVS